jgi:hypothetical protein
MKIMWSFAQFDKHFQKKFKVEILHFNKDGMCMLQMSGNRGAGRKSMPMLRLYTETLSSRKF